MNSGESTNKLYQAVEGDPWSAEYWDNLFRPLREFLILRLMKWYHSMLAYDDITDAADEIITRLYQYFDFGQLAGLSASEKRIRFHSFVKKTIQSVVSEMLEQKGLIASIQDTTITTSHQSSKHIRKEWIQEAFSMLSPQDQDILRHRTIDGATYREAQTRYAEAENPPSIDALKMRHVRALRTLRRFVEEIAKRGC
jgi:DNA-directed RNA polymerase specialized sigma24 family protein